MIIYFCVIPPKLLFSYICRNRILILSQRTLTCLKQDFRKIIKNLNYYLFGLKRIKYVGGVTVVVSNYTFNINGK